MLAVAFAPVRGRDVEASISFDNDAVVNDHSQGSLVSRGNVSPSTTSTSIPVLDGKPTLAASVQRRRILWEWAPCECVKTSLAF
jgi:hypothetical protein